MTHSINSGQAETRTCQNCKKDFAIEQADFDFYKKIDVPPPTWCVGCREIRRIAFRNERAFYKRKCNLCAKEVVSRISPDKSYPAYCKECWWSDRWDPLKYGREYDFSRSFFDQFRELLNAVPQVSLYNQNVVNSEWVNQETDDKNCYLNVGGHYNEDCAYDTYAIYSKDSFDNFWLFNSELCYGNINCGRGFKVILSQECFDCRETILSFDCHNCENIFGCAGLRNKKYYLFNKPVDKEAYEKFLKGNSIGSYAAIPKLQQRAQEVWLSVPRRFASIINSPNSTGHFINHSKNAQNCWAAEKVEDAKNIYIGGWLRDSHDESSHGASELSYECAHGGGVYMSKFCVYCMSGDPLKKIHASQVEYCLAISASNSCFGCISLRNKEYCILNKQYSKLEYESLVKKIKQQMLDMPYRDVLGREYRYGEFFPIELSPFGYNETAAQDYYPLTKEEAVSRGYNWSMYESDTRYPKSDYIIPDDISAVQDDILEQVLVCEVSGKPYRLIPMELQFYRRVGISIPRRSPSQRHIDRINQLLPRRLYDRNCMCNHEGVPYKNTSAHFHGAGACANQFKTPYSSNRQEIVYCEQCYQQEVS